MALKAICPHCNVENEPSAVNCEVCKTALGALLVGEPGAGPKFFGVSLGLSLGLYLVCWVFDLHPVMLLVSVFYGTLLTSFFAKHNVVWASALGGLTTIVVVLLLAVAASYAKTKGLFIAIAGGTTDHRDPDGKAKVVLGVIVMLLAMFPLSLIGASVGEHLSVRRRHKPSGA